MKKLVGLLGLTLLTACVDEAPSEPEPIAFSVEGAYSLTTHSSASLDLGPSSGRSCFLTGVGGWLKPDFSIRIRDVNGEYWLDVSTELVIKATARCVDGGHTAEVSQASGGSTVIAAMQPARRCFLTGLTSTYVSGNFVNFYYPNDGFDITNDGSTWSLTARMESGEPSATGFARCFDGTMDEGGVGVRVGVGQSETIGMTSEVGAACGLQTLEGAIRGTTDDGVFITRDSTTKQYSLTVDDNKYGVAGCIK
jgi:hypothetical protein